MLAETSGVFCERGKCKMLKKKKLKLIKPLILLAFASTKRFGNKKNKELLAETSGVFCERGKCKMLKKKKLGHISTSEKE